VNQMDRTLYLNEKRGLEVLRDGPSIWVKEYGMAGRRIPARLIGHVVIVGNVKLDAGAITLFTENNIPVTFMNRKGDEVALTIPCNHQCHAHYHDQRKILEKEIYISYYRQWLESERRKIQLKVVKKLSRQVASGFVKHGFKEQDYQDFIIRNIEGGDKKKKVVVEKVIGNLIREIILKSILSAGLDPHIGIINRRQDFGMVMDIFYSIEPEVDLQTIQFFQSIKDRDYIYMSSTGMTIAKDGMKDIVHRFENKKRLTVDFIEHIIDGLFETIRYIKTLPNYRYKNQGKQHDFQLFSLL